MYNSSFLQARCTYINKILAQTRFLRTLIKTIYISVIFSALNLILSVANLSRLECAEISFAQESHLYEYKLLAINRTKSIKATYDCVHCSYTKYSTTITWVLYNHSYFLVEYQHWHSISSLLSSEKSDTRLQMLIHIYFHLFFNNTES